MCRVGRVFVRVVVGLHWWLCGVLEIIRNGPLLGLLGFSTSSFLNFFNSLFFGEGGGIGVVN